MISFVNIYKKDTHKYNSAKEYIEKDDIIYAVGQLKDNGVLTKISKNGNVIFDKLYNLKSEKFFNFHQIIAVDNVYIIYATYASDTLRECLIKIDTKGAVLDTMIVKKDYDTVNPSKIIAGTKSNFYFINSLKTETTSALTYFDRISEISVNFEVFKSKNIHLEKFQFRFENARIYNNGIVLVGNELETSLAKGGFKIEQKGAAIIDLNFDFKVIKELALNEPLNTGVDVVVKEKEKIYYLLSYNHKSNVTVLSKVKDVGSSTSIILDEGATFKTLTKIDDGIIITNKSLNSTTNKDGVLYKVDFNLDIEWIKQFKFSNTYSKINSLEYNKNTKELTVIANDNLKQNYTYVIAHTNKEVESCKTIELPKESISKTKYNFIKIGTILKNSSITFSQTKAGVTEIKPVVEELCTTTTTTVSLELSTITASPLCILPSGGQSAITVQLVDSNGNPITTGGETVVISATALGTVSGTIDNNNGTYTATFSSQSPGIAELIFTVNGVQAQQTVNVTVSKDCDVIGGGISLELSSITASPLCILPSSGASTVTVQLVNTNGDNITIGGSNVDINTSLGGITDTVDNNNGTYTAVLTSNTVGIAELSFTVGGANALQTVNVTISNDCDDTGGGSVDLEQSTIIATPNQILADGTSTSLITVNLFDSSGNPVTTTLPVTIVYANGTTFQAVLDATANIGNGVYTAILHSVNNVEENAILSFTVGTVEAIGNVATVNIYKETNVPIEITEITALQSPNFYLQGAGSTGVDSTKGIHLRWVFNGVLGEKHLPKGDYASTIHNFNRLEGDYVKLYRAPYQKEQFTLNLAAQPQVVNDSQNLWVYKFNNNTRVFFVYFKNAAKYNQVRSTINPLTNALQFIQNYGDEIIEIENKRELFFASEIELTGNFSAASNIKTETLSVSKNIVFVPKAVSFRKTFEGFGLNNVRLLAENGRSIRYKTNNCTALKIHFEFYSDFIEKINSENGWLFLGNHALTLENSEAFNNLEPAVDTVNGKWLRYNDEAYVDTNNYKDKWHGPVEAWDKNIKDVVQSYIELSNDLENPKAIESLNINLGNGGNDIITIEEGAEISEGNTEVSNLDLLRVSAYDYHIARLLGLGILDIETAIFNGEYIYVAEYFTNGDLEDGLGARNVHHLSMTLPTSIQTQRLPLAVDLKELIPGLPNATGEAVVEENGVNDEDGYSYDGKKRYISIYSENIEENPFNEPFYIENETIESSTFTYPIYAGLEHRRGEIGGVDDGVWHKPELSHTKKYLNIDGTSPESFEVIPMMIPEQNNPLYIHKQTKSGIYHYAAYGINWFSRATNSPVVLQIETLLKPTNSLLPPSNINALLIRNESPLLLSSQEEQSRLAAITNNDKTLIRLSFDYHSHQELINYQIPVDTNLTDNVYLTDPTTLFPDDSEIFAEDIELFFRNKTPRTITAKAVTVYNHNTSQLLSIIETQDYYLASTGETLPSEFPTGTTAANFIGSIFLIGQEQYIVNEITETAVGLNFTVYKKEISDGIVTDTIPTINSQNLQAPEIVGDGYCTIVENMQNTTNWGENTNPHSLKVKVGDNSWSVHRELIIVENDNGQPYKYIEKTRGIWEESTIDKIEEEFQFQQANGNVITVNGHRGLYKITFNNYQLPQHAQYNNNGVSVEWHKGVIRLFTESIYNNGTPKDSRKLFNIIRTEHIGTSNNLTLYINDPNFELDNNGVPAVTNDEIVIGNNVLVNYYPGYKTYLYHSLPHGLTETIILPAEGEGNRNSIFGLRSVDNDTTYPNGNLYKSKFSAPTVMFAQELIPALQPEQPKGALYATRPDYFGRSTYTLTTKYQHKPHGVLFYRADNQAFLNALFRTETIKEIKEQLKALGGNEESYFTNRWENFLNFEELATDGVYKTYPPIAVSQDNFTLPQPNKPKFFEEINNFITYHNDYYNAAVALIPSNDYGELSFYDVIIPEVANQNEELRLIDFVKQAIENTFVPLNEVPILYKYIKDGNYVPVNEKQNTRDENGYLLDPEDPNSGFKMAPMMKIVGNDPHETYYTDFNLDGATNNVYFYSAKELSSQMKMSPFSPILGPIKLVNTNPPEAPKIKSVLPILENKVLGITPKIKLEINSYPEIQNIKKVNIYRTFNRLNAESVQTMDLIKTINLETENMLPETIWSFYDDFSNLDEVPYREQLYYRITVDREVEYAKADYNPDDNNVDVVTEYAPSKASKIAASMIVEVENPPAPKMCYYSEPINESGELHEVTLSWDKTCYNGKYHLYKMSGKGNWVKIYEVQTNELTTYLPLVHTSMADANALNTNGFNGNTLKTINLDGNTIFHHFKVVAENTSGMFSTEEKILTIYNEGEWKDIGGISSNGTDGMIIESTFVVRPNN